MDNQFNLDVSSLSHELTFLLEVMKRENTVEDIIGKNSALFSNMDWKLFLELAMHHRVYPSIYSKLNEIGDPWIPSSVIKTLNQAFQRNTFQMLHLSSETEHLSRLFSKHSIRTLFLKGPVLGYDLYGNLSKRTSNDLDILIPIQDLDRMDKLLIENGYVKDDYILTVLNDWKWRHHHFTYYHPEKSVKIEIHWRLHPGPSIEPAFNELWERKRVSTMTHEAVYILGKEDLFSFLTTHGARHGWSRLRWLADIDQMARQELDWGRQLALLKKTCSLHIAGQALILSAQLLGTPVNEEAKILMSKKRSRHLAQHALFYIGQLINLHTPPVPKNIAKYHKHHLFNLMPVKQKLIFILSTLYPYPLDAETLPLPKAMHFLYFPLHPLLWVWRKTRKHVLP